MVLTAVGGSVSFSFSIFFKNKTIKGGPRYFYLNCSSLNKLKVSLKKKKLFSTTVIRGFEGPKSTFRKIEIYSHVGVLKFEVPQGGYMGQEINSLITSALFVTFFNVSSVVVGSSVMYLAKNEKRPSGPGIC